MFVHTSHGYINTAAIIRIYGNPRDKTEHVEYHDADGCRRTAELYSNSDALLGTVVPAAAGFHVLQPLIDDAGRPDELDRMPVVAWRCGAVAEPICPDGLPAADYGVEYPDGQVVEPFHMTHANAADYLAELQLRAETKRRGNLPREEPVAARSEVSLNGEPV